MSAEPVIIKDQSCPLCHKPTLTLIEKEVDVPYFGKTFVFSLDCSSCGYSFSDVEFDEHQDPYKYTLEINSEDDLSIRVIKSSTAKLKLGTILTITPGITSEGYISNVEGVLSKAKETLEKLRDDEDDDKKKKTLKQHIKKLNRVLWGSEKIKLVLEDPEGNSAIISEKAEKKPLKVKSK
jgi:zinc finger protein